MDLLNELTMDALEAVRQPNGAFVKRDVAMRLLDELHALEGSGDPAVVAFLDRMTVNGTSAWLSGWMRKNALTAKTRKGKTVDLPQHAGLRNADGEYEQMPLLNMDLDKVRRHKEKLARSRDTLSVEISILNDIIAALEGDTTLNTVGDAFRKLGLAA